MSSNFHRFLLLALFLIFHLCYAERAQLKTWKDADMPNPMINSDYTICRVKWVKTATNSSICDPNHILTPLEIDELDRIIYDLSEATTLPDQCQMKWNNGQTWKGFKISIALVLKIDVKHYIDQYESTPDEISFASKKMARSIDNHWNYGKGGDNRLKVTKWQQCGESILILYSQQDAVLQVVLGERATGIGNEENPTYTLPVEQRLTPFITERILNEAQDFFGEKRDVARGLRQIMADMKTVLTRGQQKLNEKVITGAILSGKASISTKPTIIFTFCVCFCINQILRLF